MSVIFSGGGVHGAEARNMTAICGKSNGDTICFDLWINRPKFINRNRAGRDSGRDGRSRASAGSAAEGGRWGQKSIVKPTGVVC